MGPSRLLALSAAFHLLGLRPALAEEGPDLTVLPAPLGRARADDKILGPLLEQRDRNLGLGRRAARPGRGRTLWPRALTPRLRLSSAARRGIGDVADALGARDGAPTCRQHALAEAEAPATLGDGARPRRVDRGLVRIPPIGSVTIPSSPRAPGLRETEPGWRKWRAALAAATSPMLQRMENARS